MYKFRYSFSYNLPSNPVSAHQAFPRAFPFGEGAPKGRMRPWLSLWESCHAIRVTERALIEGAIHESPAYRTDS